MARTAAALFGSLGRIGARTVQLWPGGPPWLVTCLAVMLTLSGACQAEPVRGEASFAAANGYARLVLKLAQDVDTEVTAAGMIVVIHFKQPVDIPVDRLSNAVPDYVGSARRDPDGTAIRLSLARKVTINTMTAGERVFVDLLPDGWSGPPPALPLDVVRELSERARAAERALRQQRLLADAKKRAPVRVRALMQPTFVRFVIEMPDGVGVSSVLNDRKLKLVFSAALTFDLADAEVAAPPNVASIGQQIEGESSAVEIALIGDVDVHSFHDDKNYIVDVAFQQTEKPRALPLAPDASAAPAAPVASAPAASEKPGKGAAASQPSGEIALPTSETFAKQANIAINPAAAAKKSPAPEPPKPPHSAKEMPAAEAPALKKPTSAAAEPAPAASEKPGKGSAASQPSPEMAPPPSETSAKQASAEINAPAAAKVSAEPEMPKPARPVQEMPASEGMPNKSTAAASEAAPETGAGAGGAVLEARRDSDGLRLTFSFATPTPAAMFRRADAVWLVFDSKKPIDVEPIRSKGGAIIADVSRVPLDQGQAIRIRLNRPQLPSMTGDEQGEGATWKVAFADTMQSPTQPLWALRNAANPAFANVTVPIVNPGRLHRLLDPDAGDVLMVVTAPPPVRGFIKRQDFVELSLLESVHGVAIRPNSEDVTAEISVDKIVLGKPGGLTLSSADVAAERAPGAVRQLFDIDEWHKNQEGDFVTRQNALIDAAGAAQPDQRASARIDLARFLMARGMYPEARGVAALALGDIKPGPEESAALMLHAIASILMGQPEQGLKDLADPAVANNNDAQLWKALAEARQGKWVEAREKFKNAGFAVTSLPIELQRSIILDAMRASLEVGDFSGAAKRGSELEAIGIPSELKPAVSVLRGRLAEALGQEKDALDNYKFAVDSTDRAAAADAKQFEVALKQKRNEITQTDALRELETLSVIWRGDAVEAKTMQMMARIYAATGRYAESLAAVRTATRLQPNSEGSRQAQDAAVELFSQIFLSPKGEDLPPIDALGMFYENRDLTPIGRRGDEMIRRLADRLIAVDLLDQASELLQYQVEHRLEGAARAQVAARLAMVYLTNRKPERAIVALRSTRIADLSGELRQQRLLLEARAQSDVGRHSLALDIITNIPGREAIRLRSDIYWAARQWREASEQIELYYGDRWRDFQPLNPLEKGDVIRAVVGYALAEDGIGLGRFREKYGPLMSGEADRAAFETASKPSDANSAEFAQIAKLAAGVDTLDGFLREMKARFPEMSSRAPLPAAAKADPDPTGSLPQIVGSKRVDAAR
ncbi:tetratricopeptide repeat protein [Bradyrhizobium sp.]|uniref:tetratricopeptide repeat protein n=1 Tax=Bradyrhizobium sp. TaxID=376 RepID=UPI003C6FACF6